MRGVSFPEQQLVLGKPSDWKDADCYGLPIARTSFINSENNTVPMVTSCWELNPEEIEMVKATGKVWLNIVGNTMPPASLQVNNPFE